MKRRGITKIGYQTPFGVEWNPARWPLPFIVRAIAMLKAARPLQ